ncbi:MAG: biotin/lipoyl-binding protein [Oscillospiraceae bacterium]|jgi:biotin carboxyl carrier protein|nr:biotin/lipoyl-binding protein [Oscillospiraceae bacterium]
MKYMVSLNNKTYEVEVDETSAAIVSTTDTVPSPVPAAVPAVQEQAQAQANPSAVPAATADGTRVTAPMPGSILSLNVSEGQKVKSGDLLLILEAMKMENEIFAPNDGVVKQVLVTKGQTVDTDDVLIIL